MAFPFRRRGSEGDASPLPPRRGRKSRHCLANLMTDTEKVADFGRGPVAVVGEALHMTGTYGGENLRKRPVRSLLLAGQSSALFLTAPSVSREKPAF